MNIDLADAEPINPEPGAFWVDSHVHFDVFDKEGLVQQVIDRARMAGVEGMIAIGGSDEANERAVRLAETFPGVVQAVVGYDRDKAGHSPDLESLRTIIQHHPDVIAGIGESGLDYHYEPDTAHLQRALFESMLDIGAECSLPVVVHSREADADTLELLTAFTRNWKGDAGGPGVLHCFTGTYAFARALLDLGFMISFSGILTFRNAGELRACASRLPLDRILIETDAPYLAPVPHRGRTNEPAWVSRVAETLATLRSDSLENMAARTTANARLLFKTGKGGAP